MPDDKMKPQTMVTVAMIEAGGKVAQTFFQYGFLAIVAYQISHAVIALAGKVTQADIEAHVSAQVSSGDPAQSICVGLWVVFAAILFGIGGIAYGRRQRKLRQDEVEKRHEYQKKWEKMFSDERSSSGLTARGETSPGDL